VATSYDPGNKLAPAPPLGWNSYNAFGGMHGAPADSNASLPGGVPLEERLILQTADAVVQSGLAEAGYLYINIDDRWQDPRQPRDRAGRLRHDERRFPRGIRAVADAVHDLGLRFGLYTIANLYACGGEEGSGPEGLPATGSLGSEVIDAETFAEWGVDFLKIDWCGVGHAGTHGHAAEVFHAWNEAIGSTGRPIVLSASTWGEEAEWEWAPALTHMWRTTPDLLPTWESVLANARATSREPWRSARGPTRGWNDPDILQVGHPALTTAESWTHLVLWSLLGAPLLAGNDIRTMRDPIRRMLLEPAVLRTDAAPSPAAEATHFDGGWEQWRRELPTGEMAVATVNLGEAAATVPAHLAVKGAPVGDDSWWVAGSKEEVAPHGTLLQLIPPVDRDR
jgi:alpha-galactosidase